MTYLQNQRSKGFKSKLCSGKPLHCHDSWFDDRACHSNIAIQYLYNYMALVLIWTVIVLMMLDISLMATCCATAMNISHPNQTLDNNRHFKIELLGGKHPSTLQSHHFIFFDIFITLFLIFWNAEASTSAVLTVRMC